MSVRFGLYVFCVLTITAPILSGMDIAQKRAELQKGAGGMRDPDKKSTSSNAILEEKKQALRSLYAKLQQEYAILSADEKATNALENIFKGHFEEISRLKAEIKEIENDWRSASAQDAAREDEALWHQPDTTIGQLVIDYGSSEYIYLIPPEIASMKVHVSSQLSVPKALWSEMLELILAHYGIGVKQLNTFMRQLYFLRQNQSSLIAITDKREELSLFSPDARVCFVLQPPAAELRRVFQFVEKFVPQEQMNIQVIGNNIVLTGFAKEIVELLKVYDFVSQPKQQQEYRLVTLQKAQSDEVAAIIHSIFDGEQIKTSHPPMNTPKGMTAPSRSSDASSSFRVIAMKQPAQSLFLLGKPDQIEKACQIIQDIEEKIGQAQDKTVFWYACKHSEAGELAEVLSLVYTKMIASPDAFGATAPGTKKIDIREQIASSRSYGGDENRLVVTPPRITPGEPDRKKQNFDKHENFIVDQKTNSIVLVVESYTLTKLKELIKKLDVPKKMVQIDVLLFEKRVSDNNSFGLNLLRLGDAASDSHDRSLAWNVTGKKKHKKKHSDEPTDAKGILSFLISRHAHGFMPAYDLAYNFLLAQEDIQINANPTVTCVNQTPAKIAVVEQMSINTGVVEIDTTKATRLKDSYTREEYGIIIQITPTVHAKAEDDEEGDALKFIHLDTDIVFDTTRPSKDNRPDVTRRNIKNEVRVADGETVILGGLRRKIAQDNQEMVPFLGELPGVGKLFSSTTMTDSTTEMFIFITPRIVPDQTEEFRKMRQKAIMTRPGDLPEFLQELVLAQKNEKHKLFEQSMKMLLGRGDSSPVVSAGSL